MKVVGLTLLIDGAGFHSVTALDALTLESCTDVTLTVTVFGFGKLAGAVYAPALIVPVAAEPPATLLTAQVTF